VTRGTLARAFTSLAEWTFRRVQRRTRLVAIAIRVQHRREVEALQTWRSVTDSKITLRTNLKTFVEKLRNRAVARAWNAWSQTVGARMRERRAKLEARNEYVRTVAFRAWKGEWQRRQQLMLKVRVGIWGTTLPPLSPVRQFA
jgi:hypothetical protein